MTDLTAEKIRLVMLAIRAMRLQGILGETEPVSTEQMARISEEVGCPVPEITFRRAAARQLAIARRALDAYLAARVTSHESRVTSTETQSAKAYSPMTHDP